MDQNEFIIKMQNAKTELDPVYCEKVIHPVTSYCYGHDHKSIIPFHELSKETQEKDAAFVKKLNRIAKKLQEIIV